MKRPICIALFCLFSLSFCKTQATLVPESDLALYYGGDGAYCSTPIDDPDRPNCDECVSDGNERYIKCSSTGNSEVSQYTPNMSPANLIPYDLTDCNGTAKKYSDAGCTTAVSDAITCLRKYNKAGVPRTVTGVTCPEPQLP